MANSEIKYRILVLMSTYNGGRFIKEQLDSILSQVDVDVYLLIRDDGSKDSTCTILEEYAAENANLQWVAGNNIGFVKSFSALISMAVNSKNDFDFFAFADQDDIWMPNKLYIACLALSKNDKNSPHLFTSNSILVDADKRVLGAFHNYIPNYKKGNVLIYGTEQGCSMVFNFAAMELYASHEPIISWHDRWMYLICFFFGTVTYSPTPLFYYRLHGRNTLGNIGKQVGSKSKRTILNKIMFYFSGSQITAHQKMAMEFFECFRGMINKNDRKIIERYLSYKRNMFAWIYVLISSEYNNPDNSDFRNRFLFFRLLVCGKL